MVRRGYIRKNPLASYCLLFLFLTAIGVAGMRSDLGVWQALSSRYTMYSALFLIFAWFAIVEEFIQHQRVSPTHNNMFVGAALFAGLFWLCMNATGSIIILDFNRALVKAMTVYEHPATPDSTDGPDILMSKQDVGSSVYNVRMDFNLHARAVLAESMKLGVYQPPRY
jgi:hypothetical protein